MNFTWKYWTEFPQEVHKHILNIISGTERKKIHLRIKSGLFWHSSGDEICGRS